MIKCETCGHELSTADKFCMECGNPAVKDETAATAVVEDMDVQQDPTQNEVQVEGASDSALPVEEESASKKSNEYVEKVVETAKNYWTFVLQNLKAPAVRGFENTSKDFVYGYINFFLISLFLGLGIYFQIRGSLGGFGSVMGIGFWNTFTPVLFYSLVAFVVGAAVTFGVIKLLLKEDVSFHNIVGRFGSLTTISTSLAALYFIISITTVTTLTMFIALLLFASIQIAFIQTIYTYREESKGTLDPIYALLIGYAVFFLYVGITSQMILETIITNLIPFGF